MKLKYNRRGGWALGSCAQRKKGRGAVTGARTEELPTYQIVLSICKIGFPLQRNWQISSIIMVKIKII